MSEAVAELPVGDAAPLQDAGPSAGRLLRQARESAGLHVAALAVALKVPVRKLEALENDRYADSGDPVFVRALASSVCRTLKVDPQPILGRLPQSGTPRLRPDTDRIGTPFRAPGDGKPPSWLDQLQRPVALGVIALLLGALVILLLPMAQKVRGEPPAPDTPATAAVVSPDPAPVSATPAAMAAQDSASAVPPGAEPASQAASESAATLAPAAPAASPASTPAGGTLVFQVADRSWIQVIDGRGDAALQRELEPGESVGVSGPPPLKVTVGNAKGTTVQLRGKPFPLTGVGPDNVARFEVR